MKKVFLSGPVTGLNYQEVMMNFNTAEQKMIDLGFQVMNPIRFVPSNSDWKGAMRRCLVAISSCDAIYFLKGFYNSTGSMLEREIAIALELKMMYQEEEILNSEKL